MYELIKKIVTKVVPQSTLQKYNQKIRYIIGLTYRGRTFECNVCTTKLRKFIRLNTNDLLCPNCGSLPRTRGLHKIVKDRMNGKVVLHFSPPFSLKKWIESKGHTKRYMTTDYEDEFESEFHFNIEDINLESNSIDVIICYHVLEHIENDAKAISELYRILKQGGECYIQTPFKEGSIYEDATITTQEGRLKHFGQKDHLRIYSPDGLKERLSKGGFDIEILDFNHQADNYFGLKSKDTILVGRK